MKKFEAVECNIMRTLVIFTVLKIKGYEIDGACSAHEEGCD
jgi:hypothetical protein